MTTKRQQLVQTDMAIDKQDRFIERWSRYCFQTPHRYQNRAADDRHYCTHQAAAARSLGHVHFNFGVIALIAICLLLNCITIVAATANLPTPTAHNSQAQSTSKVNSRARHLLPAWIDIKRQSLNHRSVPQAPQDFTNFFSTLDFFIQSRQRNASEIAENIFFKYYNT